MIKMTRPRGAALSRSQRRLVYFRRKLRASSNQSDAMGGTRRCGGRLRSRDESRVLKDQRATCSVRERVLAGCQVRSLPATASFHACVFQMLKLHQQTVTSRRPAKRQMRRARARLRQPSLSEKGREPSLYLIGSSLVRSLSLPFPHQKSRGNWFPLNPH
jgi:hypothetical protein